MKIVRCQLTGDFTQIANDIARHKAGRTHSAAWAALIELYSYSGFSFKSQEAYCQRVGRSHHTWRKYIKIWERFNVARIVDGDIELWPFADGDDLLVEEDLSPEFDEVEVVEEAPKLIAAELEQQPKRKSTGLSQKDRWELVKEAWEACRLPNYLTLDGKLNLPLLIAINTHTKRLGHDYDDYMGFIDAVMEGAQEDEWWSTKNLSATQIFGFGADLDDKKFHNVEKLYRTGSVFLAKAKKAEEAVAQRLQLQRQEEQQQVSNQESGNQEAQRRKEEVTLLINTWDCHRPHGAEKLSLPNAAKLGFILEHHNLVNDKWPPGRIVACALPISHQAGRMSARDYIGDIRKSPLVDDFNLYLRSQK